MKILDKKDWFEQELKKLDHNIDSITYKYILDFSENVLEILEKKGIKNKNKFLAKKLNCSPANISKLFNGRSNFTIKKLVEIATAVDSELVINLRHNIVEVKTSPGFITSINVRGELANYSTFKANEQESLVKDSVPSTAVFEPEAA